MPVIVGKFSLLSGLLSLKQLSREDVKYTLFSLMEKEHRSTAKAMTKKFVCMVAEPGSATKC